MKNGQNEYIVYEEVYARLEEERINHKMSQEALSYELGLTQGHYSKGENGSKRFTYKQVKRLFASELDALYIFTGKKCENNYSELLENAEYEQLIICLEFISWYAYVKCKEGITEWDKVYNETKYIVYAHSVNDLTKNLFKSTRMYNELSKSNMASLIGVDVKKLRMLENNKKLPDSELIFIMYNIFGISPVLFFESRKNLQYEMGWLLDNVEEKVRNKLISLIKLILEFC